MENFWLTVESAGKRVGFVHYGTTHLLWLLAFAVFTVAVCVLYRCGDEKRRRFLRVAMICLLIADEIFKIVCLLISNQFIPKYLPFHLCSINLFIYPIHAFRQSKLLNNYLYTICIPAAMSALLFPSWTKLPPDSFMHIHSFTVHILLAAYPIMIATSGEFFPELREVPKSLAFLVGMAIPVYFLNLWLDTNFMFLMSASKGNPLYLFEEAFGNHLIGFPVITLGVILVMHLPLYIIKKIKTKKT
jgi:hypothetical integral membrane protein (TIGR02206 family)